MTLGGDASHIVQSWRNISHQRHEKERYLEDMILDEIQSIDNRIIPRCTLEVEYEGEEPKQDFDPKNL